jgi:pimeloyl-ACP methyl ester carboxylesterase
MDVNGTRLTYVQRGRGAAVVLVHGAVSDLRSWERQLAVLAQHHHAIAEVPHPHSRQ